MKIRLENKCKEFETRLSKKDEDIASLRGRVNELISEKRQVEENFQKTVDDQNTKISTLQSNLASLQRTAKETEFRLESVQNESSCQAKSFEQVAAEKKSLQTKNLELGRELNEASKTKDSLKSQLKKYEQLIDNLNEQIVHVKRELAENQKSQESLKSSHNKTIQSKKELESKYRNLELDLNRLKVIEAKNKALEECVADLKAKLEQSELNRNRKYSPQI